MPVTPAALAPRGGPLHRTLVAYKAAPTGFVRAEASSRLADALGGCFSSLAHSEQVHADVVATVPSTGAGRPSWRGVHPLLAVVRRALDLAAHDSDDLPDLLPLLERGPGALGHLRAAPDGFCVAAAGEVASRGALVRALVVDDLYTSGARAQSAAAALRDAGLEVVAIVPIGRLVTSTDHRVPAPERRDRRVPRGSSVSRAA